MGGSYFRSIIPFILPKRDRGKVYFHRWMRKSWGKNKIQPMHIEPGLYPSVVDKVVALNDKVRNCRGAQKYEYNGFYVSVDKILQKIDTHLPEVQSVILNLSADLSHSFGCDLEQNQTGVLMKGKGPHYPQHSFDIIRIHSLMIYSYIKEYNIAGVTKTPLLCCILFISK